MSAIYCSRNAEDRYHVFCENCQKIVSSDATMTELADYARANIKVYCFECEPIGVDDLPGQLFLPIDHYLIGIAEKVFLAEWITDDAMPEAKDLRMCNVSLTTYFDLRLGWSPKASPLSSSLYLNRNSQKSEAFLADR